MYGGVPPPVGGKDNQRPRQREGGLCETVSGPKGDGVSVDQESGSGRMPPGASLHSLERMEMQHESLWNEAVAFTRAKSPASFEQWFSGVQFDGMTDGVVCLRARDEFVREWVDQHFIPTLSDYLRSRTGWSVQIAWAVGGAL